MADDNKNKVAKEQLQKNNNKTDFNNVVINNSADDNLSQSLNSWQGKKTNRTHASVNSANYDFTQTVTPMTAKSKNDKK